MTRVVLASLLIVMSIGCATIDRVQVDSGRKIDGYEAIETIEIYNSNWLLLSFLPIASGDVEEPNKCSASWFRNTVTLENQMKMLEDEIKRTGASKAIRVKTLSTDEVVVLVAFLREKYHTTAVLVK